MKKTPRIGLLPLYLKLYDETMPERRESFEPFLERVRKGLETGGVAVAMGPVCRIGAEVQTAVNDFEAGHVDLLVTLHLAYSPSLEAAPALCATDLPILMLDTTMDYDFGTGVDPSRIMYNHGIHGVQDLACVLRRKGKRFQIVAGHVTESDVLQRACEVSRAAAAAKQLTSTRALRVGPAFPGMGDFDVDEAVLHHAFEMAVDTVAVAALTPDVEKVTEQEIQSEMDLDREAFQVEADEETHRRSVRVSLGLRRHLEHMKYSAFSMNFAAFDASDGPVDTVPFLEASKSMSRGIGYAGEGDVLTASLVGALCSVFGAVTFTEIFCPDWKGNALFLSHMGEINPQVVAGKPLLCARPFPWTAACDPAIITGAPAPGPAVLVNLAPGPDDSFDLLVAPCEALGDTDNPELQRAVRGWLRPRCDLGAFLEEYSRAGGTHHSALLLGDHARAMEAFASFVGIGCTTIG